MTAINNCGIMDLQIIDDPRGKLSVIEGGDQVPFDIKRVYYLYDVPGGADRGGHAHKDLHQFIIAMSGSFDVILDDGHAKKTFQMNRSYYGLYVCPMIWREVKNFSSGAVCLVLASEKYDEDDYYRNYDEFVAAAKEKSHIKGQNLVENQISIAEMEEQIITRNINRRSEREIIESPKTISAKALDAWKNIKLIGKK